MKPKRPTKESLLRQLIETLAFLAIAVTIFRSFVAEGYMISTGSMAPTLWGYHKRVVCPNCNSTFGFGVPPTGTTENEPARCPVCSAYPIDLSKLKPIEGDQILVHKNAYDVRSPRRFEVVVFRHPEDFSQAYVKRVIGLPGETVELRRGNVYIDGQLARKPPDVNLASRILIDDQSLHISDDDPDWRRRWHTETPDLAKYNESDHTWSLQSSSPDTPTKIAFRNWQRRHMLTTTSVPLDAWPEVLLAPDAYHLPLFFDAKTSSLKCRGSLPFAKADDLIKAAQANNLPESFTETIKNLFQLSHVTPITDFYAYDRQDYNLQPYEVEDVTLSTNVRPCSESGLLTFQLENSSADATVTIDFATQTALIRVQTQTLHEDRIKLPNLSSSFPVELSLVDGLATFAFNHKVLASLPFDPLFKLPKPIVSNPDAGSVHMDIAIENGSVDLSQLKVYRDIYYRHQTASRTQQDSPPHSWTLGPDELFMMGDNSPISLDSRAWPHGTIHASYLIGKPLFLHLPSRPGVIKFGGKEFTIRLPDISRMKTIH